ncbi:MAG: hypothetical protein AB7H93_07205 [Vicinamibacterales bacterium]
MTRRTLLAATPLALAGWRVGAQRPPAVDRVLAAVDDAADLRLLQEMIRMRSYSAGGEESALARKLVGDLRALGLDARLQEVEPGRFNAIGVLKGSGGGRSLMAERAHRHQPGRRRLEPWTRSTAWCGTASCTASASRT